MILSDGKVRWLRTGLGHGVDGRVPSELRMDSGPGVCVKVRVNVEALG